MDGRVARGFARRIGDLLLVEQPDAEDDDPEHDRQEQWQDQRGLDEGLTRARGAVDTRQTHQ